MNKFSKIEGGVLAILIAATSIYFVKLQILALAYYSVAIIIVYTLLKGRYLLLCKSDIGFLVGIISFILLILINGGEYDVLTYAFLVNLFASAAIFFCLAVLREYFSWLDVAKNIFFLFLIIAIFDTAYKFLFPQSFDEAVVAGRDFYEFGFYQYKGSFFYQDSNGLAFLLIPIVALGFEIWRFVRLNRFSNKLVFFYYCLVPAILLVLTLSRAAISSVVLLISFYVFSFRVVVVFVVVFAVFFSGWAFVYFEGDLSAGTKLNEFFAVLSFFDDRNYYDLFFGVGFGRGEVLSGRYIHGAFQKIFLELGLVGVFVYIFVIYFLFFVGAAWRAGLSLILMSFSSNFYFLPAFVVGVSVVMDRINELPGRRAAGN